ncbi:MAG: phenylalanine--tRNA ligase subunit beta [Alphaproteobacteria bacterium]|nr:phenylalanine--tRNA ligase subunit beta [Alphaproteobacteria bacterium]
MKWNYEWLKQYLKTDLTPEQIADKLNLIGLEVEDLYNPVLPIAAKIVECVAHPNSDHLHVLKVDDGSGELRQVVCGAPNARVGLVSALALPGCKIGDITIQPGKLRGVESNGMMCSGKELGINEDHSGIIELDESKEVIGQPISALSGTGSAVFETSITPNRPDYLSVRGIALDLSAAGVGDYIENKIDLLKSVSGDRKVNLLANEACPTYRFCEIHGIKNAPSAEYIQNRLKSAGINPKNAPIDATNYICYDLAQPMHCFDADEIVGNITVRMAENGEKFTDLFGNEHELCDKDLVITDDAGILALAGVVGGMRASTTDKTQNIILESAYFNPVSVRKSSKRHGISTDSSYRYERGIDPDGTLSALSLAADIIMKQCSGKIVNVAGAGRLSYTPESVVYNPDMFEKKTGIKLDENIQKDILTKLHFDIKNNKNGDWVITPTSQRVDVVIPENIVSELIRIYGYDKIGHDSLPENTISVIHNDDNLALKQKLSNRGLNESVSFSFGNSKIEQLLSDKPIIKVANPITVDMDTARNNLLENLLIAVSNNEKRGFADLNMFELGTVFDGDVPGQQHTSVCIVRSGETSPKHWMKRNRPVDVFDVKADLLSLLGSQKFTIDTTNAPLWAHPYRYGKIVQGKKVLAEFGELHPSVAKQLHIKTKVVVGLVENIENLPLNPKYAKIPMTEFMPITRDFAFVVDSNFESEKITSTAIASDSMISKAVIFDSFDMGNGQKSIAFTITIYPQQNMSDKELLEIQDKVIKNIESKCGAKLRA